MRFKGTPLTSEQTTAAQAIITGENCKIIAPAGSGKTMTLIAGARKRTGYGLNISFNKALTIAANKKFPQSVQSITGHALAFRAIGKHYKHRLIKLTGHNLTDQFYIGKPGLFGKLSNKAYYVLETLRNFCYSADPDITIEHCPIIPSAKRLEAILAAKEDLVYHTKNLFFEMSDQSSTIPITHDVYLKIYALSKPRLKKDFIIFDETQDANPVILDIIQSQPCQKIFAGDPYQQIYAWRGAVNALDTAPEFKTYPITQSFRYGSEIAALANQILQSYSDPETTLYEIKGDQTIESKVTITPLANPDCIICRTNAGTIHHIIEEQAKKKKVHLVGNVNNLIRLIYGISDLRTRGNSNHPDLILFTSYDDFLSYVDSPMGGDMTYLMNLLKKYKSFELIDHLKKTTQKPSQADISITTVHKAKGLEWPEVKLANDFKYPKPGEPIGQEETNILYVAATRAIKTLDISSCEACWSKNFKIGRETKALAEL